MNPFPLPWTLNDFKISENIRELVLQLQKEAGNFENQLPDDPFLKSQLRGTGNELLLDEFA